MRELIYRNEAFEIETRAGLNETLLAYKKLIEIWSSLDVGGIRDHYALATQPVKVYTDAYYAGVEVPETVGKIQISRQGFMNLIEVPVPNSLYVAAKAVTKSPGFGYRDCFVLKDGTVSMDTQKAEAVIMSQNVYAENEAQLVMGLAVPLFVKLNCFLNSYFKVIEWKFLPALPWTLVGRAYPNIADLTLEVGQMKEIMKNLTGDVPQEIKTYLPGDFDLEGFKETLKKL